MNELKQMRGNYEPRTVESTNELPTREYEGESNAVCEQGVGGMIDPSQIRTMEDARRAFNALRSKGMNNEVIAKANSYLESPMANMICSVLGVNKKI